MATASEVLSTIAPQFDDVTGRSSFLEYAESRTSSTFFGSNRPEAVAYRAAHMIALTTSAAREDGSPGAMSSKKEGDLAVSFSNPTGKGDSAYLSQTTYGLMLLDLMRSSGPAAGVTGIPYVSAFGVTGRYI